MTASHETRKSGHPADYKQLAREIGSLQKTVLFVVAACLALSVCLNVLLMTLNADLKGANEDLQKQRGALVGQQQFIAMMQRVLLDLHMLAETNEPVRKLIAKYALPEPSFTPGPTRSRQP